MYRGDNANRVAIIQLAFRGSQVINDTVTEVIPVINPHPEITEHHKKSIEPHTHTHT